MLPAAVTAGQIANAAQQLVSSPMVEAASKQALLAAGSALAGGAGNYLKRKMVRAFAPRKNTVQKRLAKKTQSGSNGSGSSTVFSARSAHHHKTHVKNGKRRKGKMTLKKRVRALEKRAKKLPVSVYKFVNVRPYSLSTEAQESRGATAVRNQHGKIIYDLAGLWRQDEIKTKILSSIPKTDDNNNPIVSSDINRNHYVKRHMNILVKNTGRMSVEIKFVRYRCKEFNNGGILPELQLYAQDRRMVSGTYEPPQSAVSTAGSEASYVPARIVYTGGSAYDETFQWVTKTDHFKTVGKIGSTILQPGDFFNLYDTHNGVYRSEEGDREGEGNESPFNTYGYVIQVTGTLATDNTNLDHVGRSDFEVSLLVKDHLTMSYANDLGQNAYDYDVQGMNTSSNGWSTGSPSVTKVDDES